MRLILLEYLKQLKESGELDVLLPDLLNAMSLRIISQPQIGSRQYGVDVSAVGRDPTSGKQTLFLFIIKCGDSGRDDWDGSPQSVRQSLAEIEDVYLKNNIPPDHENDPVKVVLVTGGEMKQAVEQNVKGHILKYEEKNKLKYELWDGGKLAELIEEHLLNEKLLPSRLQKKLRKTLALLGDSDVDLSDFYDVIKHILLDDEFTTRGGNFSKKKFYKALRTVNTCLAILKKWSQEVDNLKPAILGSERAYLYAALAIERHGLNKDKYAQRSFLTTYQILIDVYVLYANKMQNNCMVSNGFISDNKFYTLECLMIFENLGLLSTASLLLQEYGILMSDQRRFEDGESVAQLIQHYIANHETTSAPCMDGHIIDIMLSLIATSMLKDQKFNTRWVADIIEMVQYSYLHLGKYFPIDSDDFDDLVDLETDGQVLKEQKFKLSTLIPILAQWAVSIGNRGLYEEIRSVIVTNLPSSVTMQIWYPCSKTIDFIALGNAQYESGNTEAPINFEPLDFDEMLNAIRAVQVNTVDIKEATPECGRAILSLIASRHYRTPIIPQFWQNPVLHKKPDSQETADS